MWVLNNLLQKWCGLIKLTMNNTKMFLIQTYFNSKNKIYKQLNLSKNNTSDFDMERYLPSNFSIPAFSITGLVGNDGNVYLAFQQYSTLKKKDKTSYIKKLIKLLNQ